MKNIWWKALGALLILYSLTVGMLMPLKTGILNTAPGSLKSGQTVTLRVTGYNTHFTRQPEQLRAWLKLDTLYALAAQKVDVTNNRELSVTFQLPAFLPKQEKNQYFTLLLDNPTDGASVLPEAVSVSQDSVNEAAGEAAWTKDAIAGLHAREGITFPFRNILEETIRNTFYHVPMWLAMFILLIGAVVSSILFLIKNEAEYDHRASALTQVGLLLGICGIVTGAIWAKYTWGRYWSWDVKQNMTAIALLIYGAYFVLRASFEDPERKARISAVYNIFAFATLVPLLYIIPRLTDSLHPGAGGNIAFGSQDLDNTMRLIFYPAVIGWALLGLWVAEIILRMSRLREKLLEN